MGNRVRVGQALQHPPARGGWQEPYRDSDGGGAGPEHAPELYAHANVPVRGCQDLGCLGHGQSCGEYVVSGCVTVQSSYGWHVIGVSLNEIYRSIFAKPAAPETT
jgi:hypothetical protein